MTVWGGADSNTGHQKVGINLSLSDSSPQVGDTVTITATYYLQTINWTYNDNPTMHYSVGGVNGDLGFHNGLGSNQTMTVTTKTTSVTAGSSAQTVNAACNVYGEYDGSNPSVSTSITVPAGTNPATAPTGAPSTPVKTAGGAVSGTTITPITIQWNNVGASGNGGSPITLYQVQYGSQAPTCNPGSGSTTSMQISVVPGGSYAFRVRAKNAYGWGPWSGYLNYTAPGANPSLPTNPDISDASTVSGSTVTPKMRLTVTAQSTNASTSPTYEFAVTNTNATPTSTTPGSGNCTGHLAPAAPPAAGTVVDNTLSLTGATSGSTQYGWYRVASSTPSYTSAWTAMGNDQVAQPFAAGTTGDLLKRISDVISDIGQDIGTLSRELGLVGVLTYGATTTINPQTAFVDANGAIVNYVRFRVVGGGGSGGGCIAGSATQTTSAAGGGSATYGETTPILVSGMGTSLTLTIGAGGAAAGAGAAGNAGAASSAGGYISCPGGAAGPAGSAVNATQGSFGPSAAAGAATGSAVAVSIPGQPGDAGFWCATASFAKGGDGGSNPLGYEGRGGIQRSGGTNGTGYGAGSGGSGQAINGAAIGGVSAPSGYIIVEMYR